METPKSFMDAVESMDQARVALLAISAAFAVALGLAMAGTDSDVSQVEGVSSALRSED